jgi:hypothetical protein
MHSTNPSRCRERILLFVVVMNARNVFVIPCSYRLEYSSRMRAEQPIASTTFTRCVRALARFAMVLAFCSCSSARDEEHDAVGTSRATVVYGLDGRRELYETEDPELRALAASTAVAFMRSSDVVEANGKVQLRVPSLGEALELCPGEPFAAQPSAALCSGLLVGPDLVLTAGHCVLDWPCDEVRLVAGFSYAQGGSLSGPTPNDVYRCREVVLSAHSAPNEIPRLDYGFVRLDRPVKGYVDDAIAVRAESSPLNDGEPVALFGFPSGIPLKVDTSGVVTDPRGGSLDYFVSNADSFEGNSGSPVFDASGSLIGIQNRGATDYVSTVAGCNVENHLSAALEAGREKSTYAFRAVAGLCTKLPEEPFCSANRTSFAPSKDASEGCTVSRVAALRRSVWTELLPLAALAIATIRHKRRRARHQSI